MACPYFNAFADAGADDPHFATFQGGHTLGNDDKVKVRDARQKDPEAVEKMGSMLENGVNKAAVFSDQISYGGYLQLDKLLSCQKLHSEEGKQSVPDEHLFIIIHQTYELWFKQIIFDLDQVLTLLDHKIVDERKTLHIVSLLERMAKILKLLVDQILILETMSPLDFVEFRRYLTSASGFQSLQFRVLENKLGVLAKNRVSYNFQYYREVFHKDEERGIVTRTEEEPSLFVLIDRWLSRTPGIYEEEFMEQSEAESDDEDEEEEQVPMPKEREETNDENKGKNKRRTRKTFWGRYLQAVTHYLEDMRCQAEDPNQTKHELQLRREEYLKIKKSFDTITDEENYNAFVETGERRLSHNALKGALMIYFYRDMPRFSQPYQILFYLMDIDSLLQKWRYNHLMLVQRMLGSKMGSGGSSGYMYLRSTVSDRYKVFLDLFNLSTWLIPRNYIPKLSPKMLKTLSSTQL